MISYGGILKLVLPETILAFAAFAILAIDLLIMQGAGKLQRRFMAAAITTVASLGAIFWIYNFGQSSVLLNGMVDTNPTTHLLKCTILAMVILLSWLATHPDITDHIGEYFALFLLANVGLMILVSASEILMLFVGLELASLSLYVLAAFSKHKPASAEAAFKYFIFGGVAAAFLLFGLSLLYASTGETNFYAIAEKLKGRTAHPMLLVSMVMIVTGLGFKVAAVPFHFWAPDAYEGAPSISAALIASASKVASFYVLAKLMMIGLDSVGGSFYRQEMLAGWRPVIGAVALLSMIYGNIAALAQRNVKRLLAYSAIAHAGYALLALLATTDQGQHALVYYVITYGFAVIGAFAIVGLVEEQTGSASMQDFAGLAQRNPLVGLALLVFVLSLGGIPPLSGFFGKFYVFVAALHTPAHPLGLVWLVAAALAMSTLSLYYYLQILKQAYVVPSPENRAALQVPIPVAVAIVFLAALVVVLGCAPDLILSIIASKHSY